MGKKKSKKFRNIWDLTAEEQERNANEFYQAEMSGGILSLAKIPRGLNENGLTADIEAKVIADMHGRRYIEEESAFYAETTSFDKSQLNMNIVKEQAKPTVTTKECRTISFKLFEELNRLVIDDEIAPTAYSFDIGLNQEITGRYDDEDISDKINLFYHYILSLKHPSVIYDEDEFAEKYEHMISYDEDRFHFFTASGYIFGYVVNARSYTSFLYEMEAMGYESEDILKTYVSMAYACGTLHEAFFVEDSTYIEYFCKSSLNDKDAFWDAISSDPKTVFDENKEGDLICTGTPELQSLARTQISVMTGESFFDDEDDDDEDDEEEWEEPVEVSKTPEVTAEPKKEEHVTEKTTVTAVKVETEKVVTPISKDHAEVNEAMEKELFVENMEIIDVPAEPVPVAIPEKKEIDRVPVSSDLGDFTIPVIRK